MILFIAVPSEDSIGEFIITPDIILLNFANMVYTKDIERRDLISISFWSIKSIRRVGKFISEKLLLSFSLR